MYKFFKYLGRESLAVCCDRTVRAGGGGLGTRAPHGKMQNLMRFGKYPAWYLPVAFFLLIFYLDQRFVHSVQYPKPLRQGGSFYQWK